MIRQDYTSRDSLTEYLNNIARIPLQTREEEIATGKRILENPEDREAVDLLVSSNLRFVVTRAKRYIGISGLDFLDLIGYGNLGLVEAAQKHDYRLGFKFISYAVWWIDKEIKDAIIDSGLVRIPKERREKMHSINRLLDSLGLVNPHDIRSELERMLEERAVINDKEVTETDVHTVLNYSKPMFSLDAPPSDTNFDERVLPEELTTEDSQIHEIFKLPDYRKILDKLESIAGATEKEAYVLRQHFVEGRTFKSIGEELKISKQRAEQMKARAIQKLQRASRILKLEPEF